MDKTDEALTEARHAMETWCAIYAPDECSPANVTKARERISEGGTLWYIANVTKKLDDAIASRK